MIEKTVWIINRFNEKLEALIRIPNGDAKRPAVLLVGGFGSTLHEDYNSYDELASQLADAGFVTLQFTFAGKGNSEGNYEEMSLARQGAQIKDVLAWLKIQPQVNPSRIGVFALSFGVASTLSADISSVKSTCLLGGVYYPSKMREAFKQSKGYNPTGISVRKHTNGTTSRVGPQFWKAINKFNTEKACKALTMPVYILHGDHDNKISVEDVHKAFEFFPSPKKQIKIYHGGDHPMVQVPRLLREEFLQDVVAWFAKTL